MADPRPVRVLVAKPGLDGHDKGAKVVVQALRDAGMEVVYTGLHRTPAEIARAAIDEDVDVVGLSILSGAHLPICRDVVARLAGSGKPVIVGGVIPVQDEAALRECGIERVFRMGAPFEEIVEWIRRRCRASSSSPVSR
ncbi:MAG: cobalamin B12-binding domain-containing protein [Planctomycetes bacterium]|nr:cobalamin B12-binding domain-containing protein [Planctomycetota bacterium]